MSETTQKKTKSQLLDELNDLEKTYTTDMENATKGEMKLDKLTYDAPSDDEIMEIAKASIENKYGTLKDDAESSASTKKTSLTEAIENAQKNYEEKSSQLGESYDESKKSVENQAIKRGIARSSTALGELANLESQRLKSQQSLQDSLNSTIDDLNTQISSLEEELQTSLKKLDMQKAVDLNDKIEELKEARDKKQTEVTKYNNSIKETETKYNNSNAVTAESEKSKIEVDYANKKVAAVLDYYLGFDDPAEALKEFMADGDMKDILGDYYTYIYNALRVR